MEGRPGATYGIIGGVVLTVFAFFSILFFGAVYIPPHEVFAVIWGDEVSSPFFRTIVFETRIPMGIAAGCSGAMLSVAGLMMQTVFHNPLAGPSVLGISSGASFGVAVLTLGAGSVVFLDHWQPLLSMLGAMAGGITVIAILFIFSSVLRSALNLLIVGIMISYLCAAGVSLLNYFSPAEEIRNYLMWGLGSFTGLRLSSAYWLLFLSSMTLLPSFFFIKPLNAMLLGERYLESVGFSAHKIRGMLLFITGLLVAVTTSFCGPIGFIGLIVPHLCRLLFKSSNHLILLPACMVFGALVSLLCALLCILPSSVFGVLPINVITPLIGVPVILYLLVNRNRLPYFS